MIWTVNATTPEEMRNEIVGWLRKCEHGANVAIGMERTKAGREAKRLIAYTFKESADFIESLQIRGKE